MTGIVAFFARLPHTLLIAAGGAVGAALRVSAAALLDPRMAPWLATAFVNTFGCVLAGYGYVRIMSSGASAATKGALRALLLGGLLGGFTTFSGFGSLTERSAATRHVDEAIVQLAIGLALALLAALLGAVLAGANRFPLVASAKQPDPEA